MLSYIVRRLLWAIPTLFGISLLSFFLMKLAPGDFLTNYVALLAQQGEGVNGDTIKQLQAAYGLDQPAYVQYLKWIGAIVLHGDFGVSFEWRQPVANLVWGVVGWTILFTVLTLIAIWIIAIPAGVYSATHQYSRLDHFFNGLGFFGLGVPNFTMALAAMWIAYSFFGYDLTGLASDQFKNAPWTFGKVFDLIGHLWLPVLALAWHDIAPLQRTMRANLLDEMSKPYVIAARAGGLSEWRLVWEYPVRLALNPFISTVGFTLPSLISSATIVSIVVGVPGVGQLLLRALLSRDTFLAGAFILLLGTLTIVGVLISDVLLGILDPRIRYARR